MIAALVVAAGKGNRMGTEVPKQFLRIHGKTILEHTVEALVQSHLFQYLVIVTHKDWVESFEIKELKSSFPLEQILVVQGGKERADSVFNGLKALQPLLTEARDIVMVHDAVRPFLNNELLLDLAQTCEQFDAAIPVIAMKDSLRKVDASNPDLTIAVDRSELRAVQTPQAFKFNLLFRAFEQAGHNRSAYTDEASIFESQIKPVKTTRGSDFNFKITTPFDWKVAESLLAD